MHLVHDAFELLGGIILHGPYHVHVHICSLGPRAANIDVGAVTVEPVVQQLGCRLHRPSTMDIDGIVATKHGLSTEAGCVVVETSVQQFGLGSKGKGRGRVRGRGRGRGRHWIGLLCVGFKGGYAIM